MPAKTINLLPHQEFDESIVGKFLRWALSYGRYIIISTEIIVLLAFIYRFSLDRTITDLDEEVENKSRIVEVNLPFEERFRNLQDRTNNIATLLNQKGTIVETLRLLERITPQGIQFTSFSFRENQAVINARASTSADVGIFLQNLKTNPQFNNISVTTLNKTASSFGQINFSVEVGVVGEGQPL